VIVGVDGTSAWQCQWSGWLEGFTLSKKDGGHIGGPPRRFISISIKRHAETARLARHPTRGGLGGRSQMMMMMIH